jgi:hypothetical protein
MIIRRNIWKLIRYLKIDIVMLMLIMLMSISIISIISIMLIMLLIVIIAIRCLMVFVKFVKIKQNYVQVYYVLINIVWIVGDIIFDNN